MGAFGSLIGGAGQAAARYGEQQRQLQLQQWGQVQNHLSDLISRAREAATTPERQTDLSALQSKVLKLRPGQDPTKILQEVQDHLTIHPVAADALTPQEAKPQAGPPGPGETPGKGTLMNPVQGRMQGPPAIDPTGSLMAPPSTGPQTGINPMSGQSVQGTPKPMDEIAWHGPTVAQTGSPFTPMISQPGSIQGWPTSEPSPGSAAQPANSPVQPSSQGAAAPSAPKPAPQAAAPAIPPVGQPSPQGGTNVMDMYNRALASGSMPPALSNAAQPFLSNQAALQHTKDMDQYLLQQLGPQRLAALKAQTPNWDSLPAFTQAGYAAASMGIPAIQMPYGMTGAMFNPDEKAEDAQALEAAHPGILAKYHIPANTPTVMVRRSRIAVSQGIDEPELVTAVTPGMGTFTNSGGGQFVAPKIPGQVEGAINPGMQPHTTVTTTPGEAPTTQTRTVGGVTGAPGAAPSGAIPPVAGAKPYDGIDNSDGSFGPDMTGEDPLVARELNDWVSGKGAAPTGKRLTAVLSLAVRKGIDTPITLSAAGQKDLYQVDDVLGQIKDLKRKMEERKMDKEDTLKYYPEFVNYMHGSNAANIPNADLWTGLSFESIRSAATALKGTNSRAFPIISRALEHTPHLETTFPHFAITDPLNSLSSGRLPDSTAKIYNKLTEMESILEEGKDKIVRDETKSGVVRPISGTQAPAQSKAPAAAQGSGYIKGHIYSGGMEYLGGDPNQQASWKKH